VEISDSSGEILARGALELAANRLPGSILIFAAHPDDEGAHAGIIRAAVENHIPIQVVYFTLATQAPATGTTSIPAPPLRP